MTTPPPHAFSIAPMMDWTDTRCRRFHRLLTKRALGFTEMVTTGALLHGDRKRLLAYAREEHPIAVQLGGSNPKDLARCARLCEDEGFDEINLNVGCPSDRVQNGRFGACLMKEPDLVADCMAAMKAAVKIPVTVKHRIGVDDQEPYEALFRFVNTVAKAGVKRFYVHARKAWLDGLSPKDNRTIPPLNYGLVYALKGARPDLEICLNGGLETLEEGLPHIENGLDGIMLGRASYQTPRLLAKVDRAVFGEHSPAPEWGDIMEGLKAIAADGLSRGLSLHATTRHTLGLFNGLPGARQWRRILSEYATDKSAGVEIIDKAYAAVRLESPIAA